jgi:hypothetical protein
MIAKLFAFAVLAIQIMPFVGCPHPGIRVTPASLTFSPSVVSPSASPSTAQTITVTSTGTTNLFIHSIVASGEYSQTNNCPTTTALVPHAQCSIQVSFFPNALGIVDGAITITSNAGLQVISLSGRGLAPVGFSSDSLDFGSSSVGKTGTLPVTLTNQQTAALKIKNIVTSGSYSQTNDCPAPPNLLGAGQTCTITVGFHPSSGGSIPGVLAVSTDAALATQLVGLTGSGSGAVASHVTLSPPSLSFGNQEAGTSSAVKTLTLTNTSSSTLSITSVISSSANYQETDTCAGSMILPGKTCTINLTFQPSANFVQLDYPGVITVVDSDTTSPQVAGLSGTGVAPVSVSPGALSYPNVLTGTTSAAQTVNLSNNHDAAEDLSSISISGDYAIVTNSNTCTNSVPAGGNCSFDVNFQAGAAGTTTNGAVTIPTSGGFLSPTVVSLSACSGNIGLSPASLNFGKVATGTTSAMETARLENQSGAALNISDVSISGLDASDFSVANNACSTSTGLAVGASCTVDVTFTPAAIGNRSATLNFTDDGSCSPQQVSLLGGSSAGPFIIAVTNIGVNNATGTVTSNPSGITCGSGGNTCSASFATGTSVTLSASADTNSQFTSWSGACSGNSPCILDMTADKQVVANFFANPTLTVNLGGNGTGTVTSSPAGINCPAANCSAMFPLGTIVTLTAVPATGSSFASWSGACSGSGTCGVTMNTDQSVTATFNPPSGFTLTPASTSLSVQPGAQVTDIITVASQNGTFSSPVQLSCTVAGTTPRPTCGLSATSVTPGATSATSTLTITAPTTATMTVPKIRPGLRGVLYASWLSLGIFGVVLAPVANRRRRYGLAVVGCMVVVLSLQLACGGGGSSTNQHTVSPTNYTVTVTGSAGAVQHAATITVTVE